MYYDAIKVYDTNKNYPPRRLLEKLAMRVSTEEHMDKLKEALEIYRRKRVRITPMTSSTICRWLRRREQPGLDALMEIIPKPQTYRVFPDEAHLRPVVEYLVKADRCQDAWKLVKFVCKKNEITNPKLLEEVAKLAAKDHTVFPEAYRYFEQGKSHVVKRKIDRVYMAIATSALKHGAYKEMLQVLEERAEHKPEDEGSLKFRILGLTRLNRLEEAVPLVKNLPSVVGEKKELPGAALDELQVAVDASGNAKLQEELTRTLDELRQRGFTLVSKGEQPAGDEAPATA